MQANAARRVLKETPVRTVRQARTALTVKTALRGQRVTPVQALPYWAILPLRRLSRPP